MNRKPLQRTVSYSLCLWETKKEPKQQPVIKRERERERTQNAAQNIPEYQKNPIDSLIRWGEGVFN